MSAAVDVLRKLLADAEAAERAQAAASQPLPAAATPRFLSIARYAKHAGYGERKIRRWVALGLPMTNVPGETRQRVCVAEADAWIARGGAERAIESSAQRASLHIVKGT